MYGFVYDRVQVCAQRVAATKTKKRQTEIQTQRLFIRQRPTRTNTQLRLSRNSKLAEKNFYGSGFQPQN
mgnify:CR=1 FL=1